MNYRSKKRRRVLTLRAAEALQMIDYTVVRLGWYSHTYLTYTRSVSKEGKERLDASKDAPFDYFRDVRK